MRKVQNTADITMPLPLSVCIIARNAETTLPLTLASVQDLAAEIVVVINDCTDRTAEIAREFGARVYEHPWSNRRDQKNVALGYATQEWVLALDADEALSAGLRYEIIRFFARLVGKGKEDGGEINGVEFPRQTWFINRWIRHGDWYPDYSLRLFRRGAAQWSGSSEHDKIELRGRKERLDGDLLHYSFPTVFATVNKIEGFAEAFAREQIAAGRRWSLPETLLRVIWRFVRSYFVRRGFLDGYPGLYIAVMTAVYTLVRYSRIYELLFGKPAPKP